MDKTSLQPASVFKCFAQVNQIPRPSKKEEKMKSMLDGLNYELARTVRKPAARGQRTLGDFD